jgi:hypothetical protein
LDLKKLSLQKSEYKDGHSQKDLSHDKPKHLLHYELSLLIQHSVFTMTLQRISLFVRSALTTFIPRLIPLLYAALAWLTINGQSLITMSIVVRAGAVAWACILWFFSGYIEARLQKRFSWFKHRHNTMIGRRITKLHNKLRVTDHQFLLALLVAGTTRSTIPDVLIITVVRRKLSFPLFLLATIIGKFFVYTPIIYGVEFSKYLINLF